MTTIDTAGKRQEVTRVSAQHLAPEHYRVLARAIKNLLSLEIAMITMAQLVDGLPTSQVACSALGHHIKRRHPITQHEEVCPEALERTKEFHDAFDPASMMFDARTIQAYQDASPGFITFNLRLLELLAVSIHQIAVFFFKLKPKSHSLEEIQAITDWEAPPLYDEGRLIYEQKLPKHPTLFFHIGYMDHDQYPDGLADIAGYWAEDRIFGAVILFDRGESGSESKDIYLHAGRLGETSRIWRPSEDQINAMLGFLAENPSDISTSPFPMFATDLNFHLVDPWDAMAFLHIFRDPWERRIPFEKPEERDVRSAGDYPELIGWAWQIREAAESTPVGSDEGDSFHEIAPNVESWLSWDGSEVIQVGPSTPGSRYGPNSPGSKYSPCSPGSKYGDLASTRDLSPHGSRSGNNSPRVNHSAPVRYISRNSEISQTREISPPATSEPATFQPTTLNDIQADRAEIREWHSSEVADRLTRGALESTQAQQTDRERE